MRHNSLTTYEVADALQCEPTEALQLCKAAGIQHERIGQAYLWDRREVERLAGLLKRKAVAEETGRE